MTNRMTAQRERYYALGFIPVESMIPAHRKAELLAITQRWRAEARRLQAPPTSNPGVHHSEKV